MVSASNDSRSIRMIIESGMAPSPTRPAYTAPLVMCIHTGYRPGSGYDRRTEPSSGSTRMISPYSRAQT